MITRIATSSMTKEQWNAERLKSIGGSDAAALLGLNPYKSAFALWAEKTGEIKPEDISDREAVRLGNDLEDYVARRFMEATGKKVRRENHFIFNDAYPFAHALPDRMIVGEAAGLECKTTSSWERLKLCRDGEYPKDWYCQCVHYMMVTGAQRWYLAVLCFGHGFYYFTIERDEDEIRALADAEGGCMMFYSDEFGNRINLPPLPGEPAIEAIQSNRSCLIAMLDRLNREAAKNTCKNPMVKKEDAECKN